MIPNNQKRMLYRIASIGAAIQLLLVLAFTVIGLRIGLRPETAQEAFKAFEKGMLYGLLKDELLIILMLTLYFLTFSALFVALFKHKFTFTLLGVLFTFVAVIVALNAQSAFSLHYLSEQFHQSTDPLVRERLLAAGEAIIAGNMWHSTAAYFSGFLMQGGGVLISLAMIGHKGFTKLTIVAGVFGNGLDLIQHAIHYSLPSISEVLLMVAGVFYLIWYVMLAVDLNRLSKEEV